MNEIIKYYVQSLTGATQTLKKKSILLEKPWALVDNDGAIQKLIFSKDNKLILSKNGVVTEGSWNYHPEAKSLFIDRGVDKLLLNEQYIDENVLILKRDGTDNEFFALANENTLPDYDVINYLKHIKSKLLITKRYNLLNGKTLLVDIEPEMGGYLANAAVSFLTTQGAPEKIPDGKYLTAGRKATIIISNQKIKSVIRNKVFDSPDGMSYEICNYDYADTAHICFLNHTLAINGNPVEKNYVAVDEDIAYRLENSVIIEVLFYRSYRLSNSYKIKVEHRDSPKFKLGDIVVESIPYYPIPDGKYRIKGKLKWIRVEDGEIV